MDAEPVRGALEHQLRQETHPQPALDHTHNGIVILDDITLTGAHPRLLEHPFRDEAVAGLHEDEGLVRQIPQGNRPPSQGVVRRQHDIHPVGQKLAEVELPGLRRRHEAHVHNAAAQPLGDLRHIPLQKLKGDIGVLLAEAHEVGRQPLTGEAGEDADTDEPGAEVLQFQGALEHTPLPQNDLPHAGQKVLPLRRQPHAGLVPHQKRYAKLGLQRLYQLAHRRLRAPEIGRRLRQALGLHDLQKHFIPRCSHSRILPISASDIENN